MTFKENIIKISLIILLSLVIRIYNLDIIPTFADESIYIRWSQVMNAVSSLFFLPLSDGKQPLFMWLTMPMLKIFPDPLIAGRLISVISGVLTGIVVGLITYYSADKKISSFIKGLLVFSLLPYSVFFSRFALVDSLLALLISLTFLLSLLSVQREKIFFVPLVGITLGLAWLTKSPAIYAFFLLPLNLLTKPLGRKTLRPLVHMSLSFFIAFCMYNILRLSPEFHLINSRNLDYVWPLREIIKHPLDPLIPHLKDTLEFYSYFLTPVGILMLIYSFTRPIPLEKKIIYLSWIVLPIISQSMFAKAFTARYLLFTMPFVAAFLAMQVKKFATIVLVVVFASTNWLLITNPAMANLPRIEKSGYLGEWTSGYGIKEVSEYLKQLPNRPNVVLGAEGYFGNPFDGLKMYLNEYPNIRIIGTGINEERVPKDLLNALDQNLVYWVVNSNRYKKSQDSPNLKLIATYPKPDNTFLYFFQVTP